jgi:hypothetical protein
MGVRIYEHRSSCGDSRPFGKLRAGSGL